MAFDFEEIKLFIKSGNIQEALNKLSGFNNLGDFSDEVIILSARLSDAESSNRKGVIKFDDYFRIKNQITESILSIAKQLATQVIVDEKKDLEYGDEFKEMNHKRWKEQVSDGEVRLLVQELLEKEKQNQLLRERELKEEFKNEIKVLSGKVSHEFIRLKNLFPNNNFLPNLSESTFVGIDFGTSNTVVSYMCYFPDRKDFNVTLPQPVELPFFRPKTLEEFIIPSTIFFDEEENALCYGIDAKRNKRHLHVEGKNYWSSFKTKLGVNHGNIYFDSKLREGHDKVTILNPEQAAKEYLRWLKKQIDNYIKDKKLPQKIFYTVSIPASFNSNKRQAYLRILEEIGINTKETILIDEPNAAFLNCLISLPKEKLKDFQKSHVLAFDFGAGTCDISILEFWEDSKGVYHSNNFATSSDNLIGGDNIDLAIAEKILFNSFMDEFELQDSYITPEMKNKIVHNLKDYAEQLKISACRKLIKKPKLEGTENSVSIHEIAVVELKGRNYNMEEFELSFSDFKEVITPFIDEKSKENIFGPIDTALKNADMKTSDIDYVLIIGGSCKNPYIISALEKHLPEAEIIKPGNLQSHVSKGTALNTALIYGLGKNIIDPVVSETLSIKLIDGSLFSLIKAGTSIPFPKQAINNLTLTQEEQDEIEIPIFSTGSKKMLDNFRIKGKFTKNDLIDLEIAVDENKKVTLDVFLKKEEDHPVKRKKLQSVHFMPFSSEILSEYDREVKEKERKLFSFLSKGKNYTNSPSVKNLVNGIARLHSNHNNNSKALDLYLNYYPNAYNSISYHANRCGEKKIEKEYTKLAYEKENTGVSIYNYAIEFDEESAEYEKLMKESSDKGHPTAKFLYGLILINKYNDKRGEALIKETYELYLKKLNDYSKVLKFWQFSLLRKLAKHYNDESVLKEISKVEKQLKEQRAKMREKTNIDNYLSKPEE